MVFQLRLTAKRTWNKYSILHGRAEIRNFSSSVEKYFTSERGERVKYFQHKKRNFVPSSSHVMFYLLYKHQWNTIPFHWNSSFPAKGAIYYVAIATLIFSHVKVTCYFHVWRYHVFARKLTWYFIGVQKLFMIRTTNYPTENSSQPCFQNFHCLWLEKVPGMIAENFLPLSFIYFWWL